MHFGSLDRTAACCQQQQQQRPQARHVHASMTSMMMRRSLLDLLLFRRRALVLSFSLLCTCAALKMRGLQSQETKHNNINKLLICNLYHQRVLAANNAYHHVTHLWRPSPPEERASVNGPLASYAILQALNCIILIKESNNALHIHMS